MATPSFGVYTHPVHRPDHDPTIQLEDDLAIAELVDRLGMDQMWWGEHHSGGWRIVADPMLMVARAAATTQRVRLGAAVATGLHHPARLAGSAIQLDHLTRGRLLLGVSADPVAEDVAAVGLTVPEAHLAIAEGVEALTRLLRASGPVTMTPRLSHWRLRDAVPQLRPYAGALDVRVVSFGPTAGAELAGRFEHGLMTTACSAPVGLGRVNRMAEVWQRAQAAAAQHGTTFARENWAAVSPVHVARSEAEARRQVRDGIRRWAEHAPGGLPSGMQADADADALVDALHAGGHGVVGTTEMAVDHIERVLDVSGGVGSFLIELAEWASFDDTRASLDLIARAVLPRLTGSTHARLAAAGTHHDVPRGTGRRAAAPSRPLTSVPTPARGVTRSHRDAAPESRPPEVRRRRGRHALD